MPMKKAESEVFQTNSSKAKSSRFNGHLELHEKLHPLGSEAKFNAFDCKICYKDYMRFSKTRRQYEKSMNQT